MGDEGVFGDGPAADEVFLDDPFEDLRGAAGVPGAFGVDDGNRATGADLETVDLGPGDEGLGTDEPEFLESAFQEIPGRLADVGLAALGLGGRAAEEQVPANGGKTVGDGDVRR